MTSLFKPHIILENPKYPGNVGMVSRLIANFELSPLGILGSIPEKTSEMEWMAKGSRRELEKIKNYTSMESIREEHQMVIGTGMIHGQDRGRYISFREIQKELSKYSGTIAVIFGREDNGISKETAVQCDFMIDFKLPGYQKSMNLSNSVAYFLGAINPCDKTYETRQESHPRPDLRSLNLKLIKLLNQLDMIPYHRSRHLGQMRLMRVLSDGVSDDGDIKFIHKILARLDTRISKS